MITVVCQLTKLLLMSGWRLVWCIQNQLTPCPYQRLPRRRCRLVTFGLDSPHVERYVVVKQPGQDRDRDVRQGTQVRWVGQKAEHGDGRGSGGWIRWHNGLHRSRRGDATTAGCRVWV
jgi:hypothetical protein